MYTAITISTMILGGWVLPSGDTSAAPAGAQPAAGSTFGATPAPGSPLPQPSQPSARGGSAAGAPMLPTAPSAPAMPGSASAPANVPSQLYVPLAPTDPLLRSPESPWQAPTSASGAPVLGFGSAAAASGVTPYRLPPSARSSQGGSAVRSPASSAAPAAAPSYFPQTRSGRSPSAGAKPFSGYELPPALSPYMNLTRINTSLDFDNYSLYVRPRLEQQATDQVLGRQLFGLQQSVQQQNQAVRRPGAQIGGGAPQYFMNHSVFFPGLSR